MHPYDEPQVNDEVWDFTDFEPPRCPQCDAMVDDDGFSVEDRSCNYCGGW